MSAIVQHKSSYSPTTLSLAFDAPVTAGNLILVGVASLDASGQPKDPSWISDSAGNTYTIPVQEESSLSWRTTIVFCTVAKSSGTLTISPSFYGGHIHIYEISTGYDTVDQSGGFNWPNIQSSSPVTATTSGATSHDNELVIAMWFDGNGGSGTWTGEAGYEAEETSSVLGGSGVAFSEVFEVTSAGVQTATASYSAFGIETQGLIATFYRSGASAPSDPPSDPPFLGSVRVLDSAPAGKPNPFIGTVKVVTSAPSGAPNPYLGSVVQGTPVSGGSNPVIGEVVVVTSVPAGETDEFLGTIEES